MKLNITRIPSIPNNTHLNSVLKRLNPDLFFVEGFRVRKALINFPCTKNDESI